MEEDTVVALPRPGANVEGDPLLKVQCHCRECQFISGGAPNVTMGMPEAGFAYSKGSAKAFRRSDLKSPVTSIRGRLELALSNDDNSD